MGVLDFLQPQALANDPLAAIKASLFRYAQPDPSAPPPPGVDLMAPQGVSPPMIAGPPPGAAVNTAPPSLTLPKKPGFLDSILPDDSASGGKSQSDKIRLLAATLADVGSSLGGDKGGNVLATENLLRQRQELALQKTLGANLAKAFMGGSAGGDAGATQDNSSIGGPSAPTVPVGITMGGTGAPQVTGVAPPPAPAAAAGQPARTRMPDVRAIFATISQGLQAGKDMTPYLNLVDKALPALSRQAWLDTLPAEDRPAAAADPAGYLSWVRPKIEATSGPIQSVDPRKGTVTTLKEADPKGPDFGWELDPNRPGGLRPTAGGPNDPGYIHTTAKDRASGSREGAPPQFVVYGPSWEHRADTSGPPSTTRVVGEVADKVRTQGVESLSPGEKAIWDRYVEGARNNPAAALIALMGGGGSDIGGPTPATAPTAPSAAPRPAAAAPPAQSRPQPQAQPRPAAAPQGAQPARVFSKGDLDRLPKGAPYINPSDGRVLHKNY